MVKAAHSAEEMELMYSQMLKEMKHEMIENDDLEYKHAEMKEEWR